MAEFVMIVESEADFRTASEIVKRVLIEEIEWIEPYLNDTLQWRGLQEATQHTCWKDVRHIEETLKSRGSHLPRFLQRSSGTLKADGAVALKILRLIEYLRKDQHRMIQVVILIRDLDNQPERRQGLEQARRGYTSNELRIVIGCADGKREAWVLNGFETSNDTERLSLAELQKELGFDPTIEAHRLRSTSFQEPERIRNAKVVLDMLTKSDSERETKCWLETPLIKLKERGIYTGLTTYLYEVEQRIVPIFKQP